MIGFGLGLIDRAFMPGEDTGPPTPPEGSLFLLDDPEQTSTTHLIDDDGALFIEDI